ncbi:hypothetical protein BC829DRAFT_475987 [Chytridium lagenaria]|nr:hypothetical protein BC829DRAFT_475987 [Chytridium lagenaria]
MANNQPPRHESTPLLSSESLDTVTTPTSSQHIHVPMLAVNDIRGAGTSSQLSVTTRQSPASSDAQNLSTTLDDVEAALGSSAVAEVRQRVKGQCWCCWEATETNGNVLECIDRWVTALPTPRTPPPHSHNCSRCGDPYEVEVTPVPRVYVLLTDPFLRFAMLLMVGCIVILTHWGTGLNIVDFGPWFQIRMTTFAGFMLAFCHGINFATCLMVWEHCGGEVKKHVVGVSEEELCAFEDAEEGRGGRWGEGVEHGDGEEEEDGGDDEGVDETRPLLGANASLQYAGRVPQPPGPVDEDDEEDDSVHSIRAPREPPAPPNQVDARLTGILSSIYTSFTKGFTSSSSLSARPPRPRSPPVPRLVPPRTSSQRGTESDGAGPSRRRNEEGELPGLRVVVVDERDGEVRGHHGVDEVDEEDDASI